MPSGFRLRVALVGMFFSACVGCGPRFGLPSLCDPRSESEKLAEARKFDPYPEPIAGGGDMRGARPLDFIDPRADPDLLAKQQMMIPSNVVATPVAPGGLPAPPAVYIPSSPTNPPGAMTYPPATSVPPPGTSMTATPQVVYPVAATSYAPSGAANPQAMAVYPVSAPNSYATQSSANVSSGAGSTTAPVAYGKALSSP
jgi:hypothetical protein